MTNTIEVLTPQVAANNLLNNLDATAIQSLFIEPKCLGADGVVITANAENPTEFYSLYYRTAEGFAEWLADFEHEDFANQVLSDMQDMGADSDTPEELTADELYQARLVRYNARIEGKRDRYEELAAKKQQASNAACDRSSQMAAAIPFGQPILIGHHSERRDRNYRNRIHTIMGQSVKLQETSDYYANKAAGVGTAGISSDDPSAVHQLQKKLEGLEEAQQRMKDANKIVRKAITDEEKISGMVALGLSEKAAKEALKPLYGRPGFAQYQLSNNNAEIRRVKQRIKDLEALASRTGQDEETEAYTYKECKLENRCMFIFEGKPDEQKRNILKGHGFKWSPTRGAWVRQLNANGLYAAKTVKKLLTELLNK